LKKLNRSSFLTPSLYYRVRKVIFEKCQSREGGDQDEIGMEGKGKYQILTLNIRQEDDLKSLKEAIDVLFKNVKQHRAGDLEIGN
jgi:hypothetical protein